MARINPVVTEGARIGPARPHIFDTLVSNQPPHPPLKHSLPIPVLDNHCSLPKKPYLLNRGTSDYSPTTGLPSFQWLLFASWPACAPGCDSGLVPEALIRKG